MPADASAFADAVAAELRAVLMRASDDSASAHRWTPTDDAPSALPAPAPNALPAGRWRAYAPRSDAVSPLIASPEPSPRWDAFALVDVVRLGQTILVRFRAAEVPGRDLVWSCELAPLAHTAGRERAGGAAVAILLGCFLETIRPGWHDHARLVRVGALDILV